MTAIFRVGSWFASSAVVLFMFAAVLIPAPLLGQNKSPEPARIGAAPAADSVKAQADFNEDLFETFTFAKTDKYLLIPVTIAGKKYPFVLDTGCSSIVIDSPLAEALEPTGESISVDGSSSWKPLFETDNATVGRSRQPLGGRAVSLDLSDLRERLQVDLRGVLGVPFMVRRVVHLDFDEGRVCLLRSSRAIVGERLKLKLDQHLPTIEVALPAVGNAPFLLDTGSRTGADGALSMRTFAALSRARQIDEIHNVKIESFEGTSARRRGVMSMFTIGPFQHSRLVFNSGNRDSPNLLGLDYLSRFAVTFDFPQRQLILARSRQFAREMKP